MQRHIFGHATIDIPIRGFNTSLSMSKSAAKSAALQLDAVQNLSEALFQKLQYCSTLQELSDTISQAGDLDVE
jgi:hypothetical protein